MAAVNQTIDTGRAFGPSRVFKTLTSRLSRGLSRRSVVRRHQYPSRANSWYAVKVLLVSIPLAFVLLPLLGIRRVRCRKLRIFVLATEGEFGPFVYLMEHLRGSPDFSDTTSLVMVLGRRRHALCDLYETSLGSRVVAGNGLWFILQQALLLQPSWCVEMRRLTYMDVGRFVLPPITPSSAMTERAPVLLSCLKETPDNYVAFAVHTLQYDAEHNPQYQAKESSLESVGHELVDAVRFLKTLGMGVVLLGSKDTARSHIPEVFARLTDFSRLGGLDEVVLAAHCRYFWSDCVGAWLLSAPFGKPVLMTNEARIRTRVSSFPQDHLVVPVRYRDSSGRDLTYREMFGSQSSLYKAASRGEIQLIRNSPSELVDAHAEMIARLKGTWTETDEMRTLRKRFESVNAEFPNNAKVNVASTFLQAHPHLLDY